MTLPLYVLIGGRSERFGTMKATHRVEGQPWARHVASRLSDDLSRVALVGKSAPPELGDFRFVSDHPSADGPLAGAMAAVEDRLKRFGPGCLILASCDLVRPEPNWLQPLSAAFETPGGGGAPVREASVNHEVLLSRPGASAEAQSAPATRESADEPLLEAAAYRIDSLWQPFPMVVHTRWQQRLINHVGSGKRLSFQAALDESKATAVFWTGPPSSGPTQANTPEALRALLGG